MKNLFTIGLVCCILQAPAQNNTGCFHIGGPGFEAAKAMVLTYDSNYVMGGATYSFGSGISDENFYVVKTDPSGTILWSHAFGNEFLEVCYDLIETSDHGIAAVGVSGTGAMLVVKYDKDGNQQWLKTIDVLISDVALAVVESDDGGLLISGYYTQVIVPYWTKGYLIKLDGDGNKSWEKTIRNVDNPYANVAYPYALLRTVEDHFIVGCNYPGFNYYGIAAFDKDGNYLWAKQSTDAGYAYGLSATADSGFVMSGVSCFGTCDAQLSKFDKMGNLEWSETYGDSLYDAFYSVEVTDDGGLIAAGVAENFEFPPNNRLFGYIMKTDSLGNEEWSHTLGDPIINRVRFADVHQTADGGYVAGGTSSNSEGDFFIAKFDAEGTICSECIPGDYGIESSGTDFTDITFDFDAETGLLDAPVFNDYPGSELTPLCLEVEIETLFENNGIDVFPNPASDYIQLLNIEHKIANDKVVILSIEGRIIISVLFSDKINISALRPGVYFIKINNEIEKFIKQ